MPTSYQSGTNLGAKEVRCAVSLKVEIDFNKDGLFTEPGANVTDRVRANASPVAVEYGRDQSTALAPTVSGRGSVTLDNSSKDYSPRNTASPLYGLIKPARPVRITRTVSGTTYTLFVGHTDDQPINPDVDSKTVPLSLVDSLADFRGQTITTPLYSGIRTGQAIGYILDACGWSASLRDLDAGATVIPWFWCDGKDALTALEEIIRSEGPPALLTVGASGEIVFRDRHHRITRAASITSQGTWRGSGGLEPVMQRGFTYNEGWTNIVNTATASVDVRTPQALQQVWANDSPISLSAGEQKMITVSASDPFMEAVPPVAGTDYTALSGSVTTALTRTSGTSTAIILTTVGGAAAVISGLQLRAQPVTVAYTVQVSASDSTSMADYGPRSFPGDLPWCGVGDAEAVLSTTVVQRCQPLPILQVRFLVGVNTAKVAAILARDLSDRVTVTEPETALSAVDFYVESIGHEFTGEYDHAVTFGLEAAPIPPSPTFQLDTAGAGADNGKLGGGFDDPSNILILDSAVAAHCLDAGVLAH
jgi:hypothetical protein